MSGMGMSMSQSQVQIQTQTQALRQTFGEEAGDIPTYSMHRIKSQLRKNPPAISAQLLKLLMKHLIRAHQEYRTQSGNNWACLTSSNLVSCINGLDAELEEFTTGEGAIPENLANQAEEIIRLFNESRRAAILTIQQWFEVNFNDLVYRLGQKIPWAIIQRLRRNLTTWIQGNENPFHRGIEDMIVDVAKEQGHNAVQTAEEAWEAMGGTMFT